MKYSRFEDLPVWQAAVDLAAKMFQWTTLPWFRGRGDLATQLQRAALSISNNIAEGFERGTTNELLHFLYIARGSSGEVRSMLAVISRMDDTGDLEPQIIDFKSQSEGISRQIGGWANSLQNTNIPGQRHLNDKSKREFENHQRRENFQRRLDTANDEAQQKRERERIERLNKPNHEALENDE